MPWYAAHLVSYTRPKKGRLTAWPVCESIVLVHRRTPAEAMLAAEEVGTVQAGDDDGTLACAAGPAVRVFAGVRKLLDLGEDQPGHGDEVTYNDLSCRTLADAKDLAAGLEADVTVTAPPRDGEMSLLAGCELAALAARNADNGDVNVLVGEVRRLQALADDLAGENEVLRDRLGRAPTPPPERTRPRGVGLPSPKKK